MIGENLTTIATVDDARAFAAAIAALRAEAERIEAMYKPDLDVLAARAKVCREGRDLATAPLTERADELREALADWLAGDPDGNLRDGDRIVSTLSRKPPTIVVDEVALPEHFKTMVMAPDMGKIKAALARKEKVPGVTVTVETTLRVL